MTRIVSLLTDFGLSDPFVGVMKAVILSHEPSLCIVDVSHGVPAQDIDVAALWLSEAYRWFSRGAVHVCVVDPAVGSARAALAARAGEHVFLAPDNGVLSDVLVREPRAEVRRIDALELGLPIPSRTFHGRDVFAPIAARLASGELCFADVGPVHAPVRRARALPAREQNRVIGRVSFVDHFGNLVSDVAASVLGDGVETVEIGERRLRRVGTYSEAEPGECVALVSSFGTLEVACRDGNAAEVLKASRGDRVVVHLAARAPAPELRS